MCKLRRDRLVAAWLGLRAWSVVLHKLRHALAPLPVVRLARMRQPRRCLLSGALARRSVAMRSHGRLRQARLGSKHSRWRAQPQRQHATTLVRGGRRVRSLGAGAYAFALRAGRWDACMPRLLLCLKAVHLCMLKKHSRLCAQLLRPVGSLMPTSALSSLAFARDRAPLGGFFA